jgi:hypothetical protein
MPGDYREMTKKIPVDYREITRTMPGDYPREGSAGVADAIARIEFGAELEMSAIRTLEMCPLCYQY